MGTLLLTLLLSPALAAPPAASLPVPRVSFEKHVLPNGLTVLLREDPVGSVIVNVWYKVGSKHESPGKTGFAHLFEHLTFKTNPDAPGANGYERAVNALGGASNASTTSDRTNYFVEVRPEDLPRALQLEAGRMRGMRLTQDALTTEQGVVSNERLEGLNAAHGAQGEHVGALVWDEGHPYRWPVIGSQEDISNATVADAERFFAAYYWPNNAVLVVNGDHDAASTLRLVKYWFGGLPAGPAPPALRVPPASPLPARRERTVVDPRARKPSLVVAFRAPAAGTPGWLELKAAAEILGGGQNGILHTALASLVTTIKAHVDDGHDGSVLIVEAEPVAGVTMERVEAGIHAELAKFARTGPTPAQFNRARAMARTAVLDEMQALGFAESMAEGEAVHGDAAAIVTRHLDGMSRMRLEGPRDAVRAYTGRDRAAVVRSMPAPASAPPETPARRRRSAR